MPLPVSVRALRISAGLILLAASGCRREPSTVSIPSLPEQLLGRLLHEAEIRGPAVASRVAVGVLKTVTATATPPGLTSQAIAWALAAQEEEPLSELTRVLVRRDATEALEALSKAAADDQEALDEVRTAVVEARARAGDTAFARAALRQIRDTERADRARLALVRALLRNQKLGEVKSLLTRFNDPRMKDEALGGLALAHANAGRLNESISAQASIRSGHQRAEVEARVALAEYRKGKRKKARRRALNIESKWVRAQALADLGYHAHEGRRPQEARHLLTKARATAEGIDDPLLLGTAAAHIARRLEDTGQAEQARSLRATLPPEVAAEWTADRVRRLAREGKLTDAQRAVEGLKAPGLISSEAEAAVAVLEARRNRLGGALARTSAITLPSVRWQTLGALAGIKPRAAATATRLRLIDESLRLTP